MKHLGDVRYAKSGDLRIAYQVFGSGSVDLVISPGFISNLDLLWGTSAFGPVFERLGEVARCLVFDKRGTGLSDRELGFGSLEERTDDIRAVMDAAEFERASLFGYSEGGPMSILFAATYPERVISLVLYGTLCRAVWAPDFPDGIDPDLVPAFTAGVEERWGTGRAMRPFIQHIPDSREVDREIARFERSACTPGMAREILQRNIEIDIRSVLPTVSVPTLVLHSSGDPIIPAAWGKFVADHIPDARYLERDFDYHMLYDGKNAWFTDEVIAFVTGDEPTRPSATERFLATVLFTDIVDSTTKAAEMGDSAWRKLLDQHDAVAADRVAAFGGRVVKTTGDGVLATLDGPSRAVECAFAIREALAGLGLQIRAGVHTGEVERRGDDVGGIGVNIGSRVAALAGPGEVWVSRTVKDLTTGSGLNFEDRGSYTLKGIPDKWELFSLV